jgi:hypothetical protein
MAQMLALCVFSHHSGLQDCISEVLCPNASWWICPPHSCITATYAC